MINPKLGEISEEIASLLELDCASGAEIYIGRANIDHMKNRHKEDYAKYGMYISDILDEPDYVGINPKDNSIEFVKKFPADNDYVKVAVRASGGGKYFARSLYILNPSRVNNFLANGTLKPLTSGQA